MNGEPAPPKLPPDVVQHLTAPENEVRAVEAMKVFLLHGDERAFEYAVMLYVASAKEREEPVEVVLGALSRLATIIEGARLEGEIQLHPTRMHELVFKALLRAFYGDTAVNRASGASAQRKADAPQHVEKGTWPKRPTD